MTIKTETREITIELRKYDGDAWGCDMLDDLETSFPAAHPERVPGSYDIIASDDDANDLIDFWSWEVDAANKGLIGEVLALSADERANGHEYGLTVNVQ